MTTLTARYRPGRRRATRPLIYSGKRRLREPAALTWNPGYILGMAGGALWATAALLAYGMGLIG